MKKKLLYLLLLFSCIASAQIVNIPDVNFKNKLLSANISNDVAKDVNGNPIIIDTNNDYEIQESEALLVYELKVNSSGINNLTGVEAFLNLEVLNFDQNNLTEFDATLFTDLKELSCRSNDITVLNVEGLLYLEILDCYFNELTILDVSTLVSLVDLNCAANDLNELDVTNNVLLEYLDCSDNECTTLNLNNNVNLNHLVCFANQLVTLYIKNGQDETFDNANWIENPTLEYVCADDFQVMDLQNEIGGDVIIDSFCSDMPADEHNTITGTAIFDLDNDGCDGADLPNSFVKISINDGNNQGYGFTNTSGGYTFYTQEGNFAVTPIFEEDWFIVTPASVNFPVVDGSVSVQDFCITSGGETHNDVEVVMVPVVPASPGFDAVYKIVYKNNGNQIASGTVGCAWDYDVLTPVALEPMADDIGLGVYGWNYANLQPFENREILMTLHVNSPTDDPAVNIDDILPFTATINGVADENPVDNEYVFNQVVVGAYDPNNIICIEGETLPSSAIGNYLHYVINFENTGTAQASFVIITQVINESDFDISSLQILNSSHEVTARVEGNVIKFLFDNINLNAADHGNILFKLKSKQDLQEGDNVINKASIIFDYNVPVITNDAITEFAGILGTGEFIQDVSVKVYPNPAKDMITVVANGNLQSVSLYDIQGRLLQTQLVNDKETKLNISDRQKGIYFLKVTSDKGVKAEKIVKE